MHLTATTSCTARTCSNVQGWSWAAERTRFGKISCDFFGTGALRVSRWERTFQTKRKVPVSDCRTESKPSMTCLRKFCVSASSEENLGTPSSWGRLYLQKWHQISESKFRPPWNNGVFCLLQQLYFCSDLKIYAGYLYSIKLCTSSREIPHIKFRRLWVSYAWMRGYMRLKNSYKNLIMRDFSLLHVLMWAIRTCKVDDYRVVPSATKSWFKLSFVTSASIWANLTRPIVHTLIHSEAHVPMIST